MMQTEWWQEFLAIEQSIAEHVRAKCVTPGHVTTGRPSTPGYNDPVYPIEERPVM